MSEAEKSRRYRDRLRGAPPREPKPHGTVAAMRRHERSGEALCPECEQARKERNAANYAARKAAREAAAVEAQAKREARNAAARARRQAAR